VLGETGPAHAKQFRIGAYVDGNLISEGEGKSKKTAKKTVRLKHLSTIKRLLSLGLRRSQNNAKIHPMSLVIRSARVGKRGERKFRIVVKEKRSRRDGDSIEVLGWYEKGKTAPSKLIKLDTNIG